MMARASSKILKHAVTAKSIKHHKWQHTNEEVSGDFTDSILQDAFMVKEGTSCKLEVDETGSKREKPSPSKMFKSKLKKNTPTPSAASPAMEKPKSLPLGNNEKKKKRSLAVKSTEEAAESDRSRTPSGGHASEANIRPVRISSASVPSLKQTSVDEHSTRGIDRKDSTPKAVTNGEDSTHEPMKAGPMEGDNGASGKGAKKVKSDKGKVKSSHKINKDSEMKLLGKSKSEEKQQEEQETCPLLPTSNEGDSTSVTTQM